EDRRRESDRRRSFVEQDVARVAGGGHGGARHLTVVLVGVLGIVDEYEVGPYRADDALHPVDEPLHGRKDCVAVAAPVDAVRAQDVGRAALLAPAPAGIATATPVGHHQKIDARPLLSVLDERTAAAELDVVRVGANRQDVHAATSRTSRTWRIAPGPQFIRRPTAETFGSNRGSGGGST